MKRIINIIKMIFCKHEFETYGRVNKYGIKHQRVCSKCDYTENWDW